MYNALDKAYSRVTHKMTEIDKKKNNVIMRKKWFPEFWIMVIAFK